MTSDQPPSRCIAVDARCLQDASYAERGVGRHTVNLLRRAPRDRPLIGLVDPLMPTLAPAMRALFETVRPNAQFREFHRAAAFISPSPMTHDPLFAGRLLLDPRLLKATVIYDFIPWQFPERYLADQPARHAYVTCLRWLTRYDLFLPISQASAAPLRSLLGIADDRIIVAGAALDPAFETPPDRDPNPTHVLAIGGGDPRKNVECAIRAHAIAPGLQRARIPLVITGHYPPDQVGAFHAIAAGLGGDTALLRTPGRVDEATLIGLYRDAICAVAASRAEGFDLPIVEAMAAGAPALASDIPAHRELVEDPELRFAPDDHGRLAGLIDAMAGDSAQRARTVAGQASLWPRYRATAVAERFWAPIEAALTVAAQSVPAPSIAAPAVLRGRRPRLAMLAPLPPDRSGVADYTAATCAELGKLTELHLFTPTATPSPLPGAATVRPLSALPNLSVGFDRVVNVMGNSDFHLAIFHQLLRYGGACIGHDNRMIDFYHALLGMGPATTAASRELGRAVTPDEVRGWMAEEHTLEALFYGDIVDAADPIMVHSSVTAELIRQRYKVAPILLPFCIYRTWQPEDLLQREAARRRLALRTDEVVIVTFGFIHTSKAPMDCLWALEILRSWGFDASLHFVGDYVSDYRLDDVVDELGLRGKVNFLGSFVSDQTYRDYLCAADVGVQVRPCHLGGLSGALLDCIAAGLPTVTNASLAEIMSVPSYVRAVPDHISPLLIAEAFADLLDAGVTRDRQEAMRIDYAEAHSFETYAKQLCQGLGIDAVP